MLLVFVLPLSLPLYGQTSSFEINKNIFKNVLLSVLFPTPPILRVQSPHQIPFVLLVTASFLALVSQDLPSFLQVDGSLSLCVNSLTSALFSPKIEVTAMTYRLLQAGSVLQC